MDPITLEVISSSLTAYADEMTNSFWRSSYSYMNYEVRDFAVGFIDRDGRIIMQSRYTHPAFTGDLGYVVKDAVEKIGEDEIVPGDIIATNDPVSQGQHLNNVVVFAPQFCDGAIFGYSCVRAHLHDLGGAAVGSGSPSSTDIFQEGLQIDAARIYRGGKPNLDVLRFIERNTRFPDLVIGDLNAQVASCKLGLRRLGELIDTYGAATLHTAVEANWDMAEKAARRAVRAIPDGTYSADSFLDNDGVELNKPVPIKVKVVVAGDDLTIDFSDISDQVRGSLNSGYFGGATNVGRIAFKCLTTPHLPSSEGCFRPVRIICPEGKLLNARRPAAYHEWSIAFPTIIDTIFKALSPAMVGRLPAATRGDPRGARLAGFDPVRRRYFMIHIPHPGGHGARPNADGPAPKCSIQQGNEHSLPCEVNETKEGVVFDQVALRQDSGGPGRYRGGMGVDVIVHLDQACEARNSMIRSECKPWGFYGGGEGATNDCFVINPDSSETRLPRTVDYALPKDARLHQMTGGGGGYGDPFTRPIAEVREDLLDGYISRAGAERDYGIVFGSAGEIDEAATARRRHQEARAAQ
jgi:N-methylhydantoinase B